jgi:dienelactone hydrolase
LALAGVACTATAEAGQEAEWRKRIRDTLFVPEPLPALVPQSHGSFEPVSGVIAERISYGTQFGMRVPAILYRPRSPLGRIPALVVVNGHGGDKYSWYAFYAGILYARAGAAVLTYDPIGEGERNARRESGTRAHDKLEQPEELGRRMGGLMMTDVMQAVSYLRSRAEVDSERIGAMGYSMGSFVLALACAVETRLKVCVLVGGGNLDEANGYWDNSKPMCQGIPYRSLGFLGDRPAVLYALHAARGPTLIYNGLEDSVVAIPRHGEPFFEDLRRRVARLRGAEAGLFETGFVAGASHRPYFVTRPVAQWLERELGFPVWSADDIASMPETHISQWARSEGVAMDPLYATEHREGGARALGSGVPGIGRHQLNVFSPDEWRRRKRTLIYERWIEEARSALSVPQKR